MNVINKICWKLNILFTAKPNVHSNDRTNSRFFINENLKMNEWKHKLKSLYMSVMNFL